MVWGVFLLFILVALVFAGIKGWKVYKLAVALRADIGQ